MVLLYPPSLWNLVSNVVGSVLILFLVDKLVLCSLSLSLSLSHTHTHTNTFALQVVRPIVD